MRLVKVFVLSVAAWGGIAAGAQSLPSPKTPVAPSVPEMPPTPATAGPQVGGDPMTTLRPPKSMKELTVKFIGSDAQSAGKAMLKPVKLGGVRVSVRLQNIPAGPHAIHLHQNADCTGPDFKSAGGHFNPTGKQHGFDNPAGHHAGDVNLNITVGEDHTGSATFVLKDVTWIMNQPNSVFANGGTALVVHEKADDMKTDPSGASGNRIACAVVKP